MLRKFIDIDILNRHFERIWNPNYKASGTKISKGQFLSLRSGIEFNNSTTVIRLVQLESQITK